MPGHQKFPTTKQILDAAKSKKSTGELLDNAKYYEHVRGCNETPKNNLKGKTTGYQDYHVDILKGSFGKLPKNEKIKKKGK